MYLRSVESPTKAIKHNGKFNWLRKKILTRAQISLNGSRAGTKTERFTSQLNLFVFLSSNHNALISIFPFLFCPSPPLVRAVEQSRQRRRQGLSTPKIKFCNHYLPNLIKFVWKPFINNPLTATGHGLPFQMFSNTLFSCCLLLHLMFERLHS